MIRQINAKFIPTHCVQTFYIFYSCFCTLKSLYNYRLESKTPSNTAFEHAGFNITLDFHLYQKGTHLKAFLSLSPILPQSLFKYKYHPWYILRKYWMLKVQNKNTTCRLNGCAVMCLAFQCVNDAYPNFLTFRTKSC